MNEKFSYILANIEFHTPGIVEMAIGTIFAIASVIFLRYAFLYAYGAVVVTQDARELRQKKETLTDLILMKDIQTELEKEIEQAMLKATFQG
jgi:uncharacterized membrane protein YciS (DUF1049 family)